MDEKLKKEILWIIDDSSGGIKGVELLTKLLQRGYNFNTVNEAIQSIESIPTEIPELGVLVYCWNLSEEIKRVKYFIYRKL